MSRQVEFVQAVRDWDNANGGSLQVGKFHPNYLATPNQVYHKPNKPYLEDSEYVDFETVMNTSLNGFADQIPEDSIHEVVGYALDRLFDWKK